MPDLDDLDVELLTIVNDLDLDDQELLTMLLWPPPSTPAQLPGQQVLDW